ncbi:MAG: ABC transporter substrate-binding protein [Catonella sp.]|uniref:ABC transporter substrate-binding protein n=1 Tax=Catonella sp. TaxID=2382125 RepID=UPI003F9F201D
MNKIVALGLAMTLMASTLTACGENTASKTAGQQSGNTASADKVTVAIGQFAEHGSLDNCREGFIKGLAEEGFKEGQNLEIIYENASADSGMAAQIANNFVAKKVNLICAITTPMAQISYSAAKDTDIPVIYTAITNPVAAELAKEDGSSVGNITGTSDKLPIKKQLEMIKQIMPDAKKIGILYCTSEVNSEMSVKEYKEAAKEFGFEIVEQAITSPADVPLATDNILTKVDCLNNITDNTVVNSLDIVIDKAKKAGKPVFGSEIEQVKKGCVASMGLDYVLVGEATGKMAAKILKGEAKAGEMKFESFAEADLYGNEEVAKAYGLMLPEGYKEVGK